MTPPVVRVCYYHDNSLLAVALSSNQKTLMNHRETEDDAISLALSHSLSLFLALFLSLALMEEFWAPLLVFQPRQLWRGRTDVRGVW